MKKGWIEQRKSSRLFRILFFYALFVATVSIAAIYYDAYLQNASMIERHLAINKIDANTIVLMTVIIFAYYLLRVKILKFVYYLEFPNRITRWSAIGGIILSVPIEVIWLIMVAHMFTLNQASCDTGGDFSDCGWASLAATFVALGAIVSQFFGMACGALLGFNKNLHEKRKFL
jgi:hypothetical protein